jgi:hypothetical protein
MISKLLQAKYASELSFLQGFLEEEGMSCALLDTSQGVELPVLITARELGGQEVPINFIFVPLADELEVIQLMQIYATIPLALEASRLETLEKMILLVNRLAGLGTYGLDPENQLYYKYIFVKPKYAGWDRPVIVETIYLFMFLIERFSGLLQAVAAGKMSGAEAVQELNKLQSGN